MRNPKGYTWVSADFDELVCLKCGEHIDPDELEEHQEICPPDEDHDPIQYFDADP